MLSRSFFVGAFIAVAIRWVFLNPVKAIVIALGLWATGYALIGFNALSVSHYSNKAEGLELSVGRQFGIQDGYGGSARVEVRVENQTGMDIKSFTADCGDVRIKDDTGIALNASESRTYEIGTMLRSSHEVAACRFSDIEFGEPTPLGHGRTYGRMS